MPESKSDLAARAKEAIWRASDTWREALRAETWPAADREVVLQVQDLLGKLFDCVRDLRNVDDVARERMEAGLREIHDLPTRCSDVE